MDSYVTIFSKIRTLLLGLIIFIYLFDTCKIILYKLETLILSVGACRGGLKHLSFSAGEDSARHRKQFEMHYRCKQQVTYIHQLGLCC